MSRRSAREKAFMFLYQIEIQRDNIDAQLEQFLEDREVKPADRPYLLELVHGVNARRSELDRRFAPLLHRWKPERLPKVDLAILRLAVFELDYVEDVPARVAISEAVLLAKKFSADESRSYINAVLGRLTSDAPK